MRRLQIILLAALTALATVAQPLPPDSVLRDMAARVLMVGFTGNSIDDNSPAAHYVRDLHVGGIILFDIDLTGTAKIGSRNITSPEQLHRLTSQLHAYAGDRYRLLIAVDQEGGRVCRLKTQYGFSPTVSARYLGTVDNPDTTALYASRIARELASMGINVNLAPVIDVHNPLCPPLGKIDRCFSDDLDVIGRNALITIARHADEGVLCVAKHFPGHGNATADSHYGLVDVSRTWQPYELEPYRYLIAHKSLDAVMTAHVYNSNIDPDYPSTLSHKTLTGVLREQLGFEGLIITDDLYMEGIIDHYDIREAIALALNAGTDILLAGNNITTGFEADRPDKMIDIIVDLVKSGTVPYERLLDANRRIDAIGCLRCKM
ncbi:MAG: glycoside hydrolase family 3 protein [Muribaculaceae bacterium]|nr:glycoside hydrolase family 3 protein [Muribaculaceae bacterium]